MNANGDKPTLTEEEMIRAGWRRSALSPDDWVHPASCLVLPWADAVKDEVARRSKIGVHPRSSSTESDDVYF